MSLTTAATALGEFVARTSFEQLPPDTVWEAKRRVADVIAAGLSGSTTPVGRRITEFVTRRGASGRVGSGAAGRGGAGVWGSDLEIAPAYAALANATMTFHLELDDVHRTSHTHPGVSVIPAALALCEERGLSGRDLLLATVVGYEVEIRIGLAVSPSIYVDRTFLAPGTLAAFGAAAAAAKLWNQSAETAAGSIGTASYLGPLAPFESFRTGAAAKDTIFGWSSVAGIHAAELAASGFGGPATSIDGDFGYCRTTSDRYDLARLHDGLGSRFEILYTGIKPYACCRQHHTAVDAVLELREHGLSAKDVDKVRLRTFVVASRGTNPTPTTVPAAKYSAPYTIAVACLFGRAWRDQYTMELMQDPEVMELASRVEVTPDQELEALYDEKWASIVEVRTKDGRQLSARRDLPAGEPEHRLSDEALKTKFLSLACDAVSRDHAEAIWEAIFRLDQADTVTGLTDLLRASAIRTPTPA